MKLIFKNVCGNVMIELTFLFIYLTFIILWKIFFFDLKSYITIRCLCVCAQSLQLCPAFCDTMGRSPLSMGFLNKCLFLKGAAPTEDFAQVFLVICTMYTVHIHSVLVLHHYAICIFAGTRMTFCQLVFVPTARMNLC